MKSQFSVRSAIVAACVAIAAAACAGGDTSLYVRNDSGHAWYVSVERSDRGYDYRWGVKVAPGADAFALSWDGGPDVTVTVRGPDCSPVGTFRATSDDTYVVDAVPGLTGRVERHGAPAGSRTTTPGVKDTEDCGGELMQ